jgi:hypothetical protein
MGSSSDEIDRQIRETREHIDENLGLLEERATTDAVRYGRIVAIAFGVAVIAGAGILIYRRVTRPSRLERLHSRLIDTLRELPGSLRDMPEEVVSRLKKPLPSIQLVINGRDEASPGTFEGIVRKVAPAVVGTATSAVMGRLGRRIEPAGSEPD